MSMSDRAIARVCHEANRALCAELGDLSQPEWRNAPEWQVKSALHGVRHVRQNPDTTPEQTHESWLEEKRRDGWVVGPKKNPTTKEHPCMVPYNELPHEQRYKDALFTAIVKALI